MSDQLKKQIPFQQFQHPYHIVQLLALFKKSSCTPTVQGKKEKKQLKVSIVQLQRDSFAPEVVSYA